MPEARGTVNDPTTDRTADDRWERRWHPLLGQWVIVAAHRQDRPWSGERVGDGAAATPPAHDPTCHLCPGVRRVGGETNPDYTGPFAFDNDRPSLGTNAPADLPAPPAPYRRAPAFGRTRVLCYTPRHDLSLARLGTTGAENVIGAWRAETRALGAIEGIESVLAFENRGEISGVSNPHAHGQVYATGFRYDVVSRHLAAAAEHERATGRTLYADILDAETTGGERIVAERERAVAFVPWFARYAYEVHVAPRRTVPHITALDEAEVVDLAAVLHETLVRYDNLWGTDFPYLLTLQQAPVDGGAYPRFHCHVQLAPPLRKPGLKKYLGAHEIGGGNFLADTVPEDSAAALRATSATHWRDAS